MREAIRTIRALLRRGGERGNIVLITLVSVAVITVLGIAVYDLAQIEGQFSQLSLADYRAYEIAQAGIERGVRELRNGWNGKAAGAETWTLAEPACAGGCAATQYRAWNVANNTVAAQTVGGYFTGTDPGGTYSLEIKLVTVGEANNPIDAGYTYPLGQTCISDDNLAATLCHNLVFVRSTGTSTDTSGNTRTRTIQTLVKATSSSPWDAGIVTVGDWTSLDGSVLIAGSIHILGGLNSSPAVNIWGGSHQGIRNNYWELSPGGGYTSPSILDRLTPKQLICPQGSGCAGSTNLVESLGATIKVFGNIQYSLVTANGVDLGQSGSTGNYGVPARAGKGPLDGVYIADGCSLPCTGGGNDPFTLAGGATVTVDRNNITKPYPYNPPRGPVWNTNTQGIPMINDTASVAATDYAQYYSGWFGPHTDPGLGCAGCTAYLAGTNVNALIANGGTCATGANCDDGVPLNTELGPLTDAKGPFRHTFKFRDKTGALRTAEMCWRRASIPVADRGANLPVNNRTLEFGMPTCATPSVPTDPVLFSAFTNLFGIDRSSGNDYYFRGAAIVVTNANPMIVEEAWRAECVNPSPTNPPCVNDRFPDNHLFAVMNTNGIDIAVNSNNVNRVYGYFFSMGNIRIRRDVSVVGMLRGVNICFQSSAGCGGVASGGQAPGFFQAGFADPRKIPQELPAPYEVAGTTSGARWLVGSVPQFFMECRLPLGQGIGNLPTTPTGICGYQ